MSAMARWPCGALDANPFRQCGLHPACAGRAAQRQVDGAVSAFAFFVLPRRRLCSTKITIFPGRQSQDAAAAGFEKPLNPCDVEQQGVRAWRGSGTDLDGDRGGGAWIHVRWCGIGEITGRLQIDLRPKMGTDRSVRSEVAVRRDRYPAQLTALRLCSVAAARPWPASVAASAGTADSCAAPYHPDTSRCWFPRVESRS